MPPSRQPHARKPFRLLTLGGGALVDAAGAAVAGQRRRIALLVLLASSRERGVSRDKLVAALSPESTTESARHALHQLLYYLRQQMGDGAFLGTDPLRLDPDVVAFDVAEFEQALEAGALERAVALYRGPFLDGFHLADSNEFEEWAAVERSRLAARQADALGRLAEAAAERADHAAACSWWRRLAELDPLSGRAALGLARSLVALGDRAGAVREARVHQRLLRAEIGGEPPPELADLLAELQRPGGRAALPEDAAPSASHARDETVPTAAPAASDSPPPRIARPAVRRGPPAAAATLLVLLAGAAVWLGAGPAGEDTGDTNLLAVAPFEVLEPSLEIWREGMGDVLSRTLDGAGPIRTVSPTVVLRRWSGRADRASAEALGRRTGAGLVLYGAVVPRGRDSVTLRAALLDRAGSMGKTDLEVSGEAGRIADLADSLGIRALGVLSAGRPIGSVRHMSIGSRSVPALKAFLQGEQFYRRGQWDSALTRYDQAIAADSTFALALMQMGSVLQWNPPTAGAYRPSNEYLRRATLHNHGLPARESLLIALDSLRFAALEAADPDSFVGLRFRSMAAVEEAVRRYPKDPLAWYWLGEERHDAPWPIQTPPSTAMDAFARAIALDPGFAPAYEHVPSLLVRLGRPEEASRNAEMHLALDPTSPNRSETRLAALLLDPHTAGSPEVERFLDTTSVFTLFRTFENLAFWTDTGETVVRLMRRLAEPGRSAGGGRPWHMDTVMWPHYLAHVLAFRGHLREASAVDERLLRQPSASRWSGFLDPFLDLSLLGIVPDSLARATFGRSLEAAAAWEPYTPRHLRGLPWWLSRGDTAALARFGAQAARTARAPATPSVALRARLLGETSVAFLDLARGDTATAISKLSAIPDTLCLADEYAANCFHLNLTLARLLAARGDDRRAAALLERWRWSGGSTPSFVLATLELGRIAERLGDTRKAAECYDFVMAAWHRPDPELLTYVAEAREGKARLGPD
ncbi:MAG TPA: BTAD domain-containing putative transcriptional regulator [Gemmatimonadales bacterium]